jgi:hypothetical protein
MLRSRGGTEAGLIEIASLEGNTEWHSTLRETGSNGQDDR